ncbi:MAG TPA: hypothetical protein VGH76_19620 [Actinomycetospora sp.]|uniref:hypothetical protein n=1 Tax=Actinomycetospora sp. TaxID=1872135 RepID=UPI002F3F4910
MNRRAVVTALVAVVLLVVGVLCVAHGVDTAPSTGGLLVSPVPLTRVLGAWVASGVVLVTAALVCGIDAVARWRAASRTERADRSGA